MVGREELLYGRVYLRVLLRSQRGLLFFPSINNILESLQLKVNVKHGTSSGNRCHPRGSYKIDKICFKEPSSIEFKRIKVTLQTENCIRDTPDSDPRFQRAESKSDSYQGEG